MTAEVRVWGLASTRIRWAACRSCDNLVACLDGISGRVCSSCCGGKDRPADLEEPGEFVLEVQLHAASGPRIVYGPHIGPIELGMACPVGWEMGHARAHVRLSGSKRAVPLRRRADPPGPDAAKQWRPAKQGRNERNEDATG